MSRRAKGLLVELISRPPEWQTSASRLVRKEWNETRGKSQAKIGEGLDAIRDDLAELESYGYLEHQKIKDSDGRWSSRIIVFDTPVKTSSTKKPKEIVELSNNQVAEKLYKDVWIPAGRGISAQKKSTVVSAYLEALENGITAVRLSSITSKIIHQGDFINTFTITQTLNNKGKYGPKNFKGELKADIEQDWKKETTEL
jgi:hypothetical protein